MTEGKIFSEEHVHSNLTWDSAPGFWLMENCRVLVLEYSENEVCDNDEETVALLLDDYGNIPAYTQLDLDENLTAEWMGTARVRVDDTMECSSGAQVGRLLVYKGVARITSVKDGRIKWLNVPQAFELNDGDYGFTWSVDWQYREGHEATVFEALDVASWLNAGWRRLPSARLS